MEKKAYVDRFGLRFNNGNRTRFMAGDISCGLENRSRA